MGIGLPALYADLTVARMCRAEFKKRKNRSLVGEVVSSLLLHTLLVFEFVWLGYCGYVAENKIYKWILLFCLNLYSRWTPQVLLWPGSTQVSHSWHLKTVPSNHLMNSNNSGSVASPCVKCLFSLTLLCAGWRIPRESVCFVCSCSPCLLWCSGRLRGERKGDKDCCLTEGRVPFFQTRHCYSLEKSIQGGSSQSHRAAQWEGMCFFFILKSDSWDIFLQVPCYEWYLNFRCTSQNSLPKM